MQWIPELKCKAEPKYETEVLYSSKKPDVEVLKNLFKTPLSRDDVSKVEMTVFEGTRVDRSVKSWEI